MPAVRTSQRLRGSSSSNGHFTGASCNVYSCHLQKLDYDLITNNRSGCVSILVLPRCLQTNLAMCFKLYCHHLKVFFTTRFVLKISKVWCTVVCYCVDTQFAAGPRPDTSQCCQLWLFSPHSTAVWRVHVLPCRTQGRRGNRQYTDCSIRRHKASKLM